MKMVKTSSIFMLLISFVSTLVGSDPAGSSTLSSMTRSLDAYFGKLDPQKQTLTKLRIYIHANFATDDKDQTVFQVATSEITSDSPGTFGRILVIDNPLTLTSDPGSEPLGRYQGVNAYSDFHVPTANMNMNMVFSGGAYEGSSMNILGRQPVNEEVRVLSVIGGTGFFRMAKGVILASTLSLDPETKIGHYVYVMYVVTPAAAGRVQTA